MGRATKLTAVLEIGSTGIRMLIAELAEGGRWRVLDHAEKQVALGRDVFTTRVVSRESLLECLMVIQSYRELLNTWGIADSEVKVIGTSALRAARNRDMFVDRLKQETGFSLNIVEGIEENRLMYLAVRFAMDKDFPQFWRVNSMIIEIGGGSTEIMLLRRGDMVAAHSISLGTIIIDSHARRALGSSFFQGQYLEERVRNTSEFLNSEMDLSRIRTIVAAGSEMRFLAGSIGREVNEHCRIIPRSVYIAHLEEIKNYSIDDCVRRFNISPAMAESFIPVTMVYKLFLERTAADQIVIPFVSIREGLLVDITRGVDSELQEEFLSQIITSAANLGRKFHFDENHHRHVAKLCMIIFDALLREHGMNRRERMMLEVAAMLHDVGTFIRNDGHAAHGQYIVANSEIFGLHREELNIIATVIRYHRGDSPSEQDYSYIALQRQDRVLVLKMTSILRVADALDRGHNQRIRDMRVERRNETVLLHTGDNMEHPTEKIGLTEKGGMFQDVFGYKVVLE